MSDAWIKPGVKATLAGLVGSKSKKLNGRNVTIASAPHFNSELNHVIVILEESLELGNLITLGKQYYFTPPPEKLIPYRDNPDWAKLGRIKETEDVT